MSETGLLDAALAYAAAGLSVIATGLDKLPRVGGSWKAYQKRPATAADLRAWLREPADKGIAIVCGEVSGSLEMVDFDCQAEWYPMWAEQLEADAPGLLARLIVEQSQSGGKHVVYRRGEGSGDRGQEGNQKLAQRVTAAAGADEVEIRGKKYKPRKRADGTYTIVETLIETRGEGGYFLCAPSRGYSLLQGSFAEIPVLSVDERAAVFKAARALDEEKQFQKGQESKGPGTSQEGAGLNGETSGTQRRGAISTGAQNRPGDAFNEKGDLRGLLVKHGWTRVMAHGEREYWRRPGKKKGWSASLTDGKVFWPFSSNAAPFEMETSYSPFAVFALLECGGDYVKAAEVLQAQGFGVQPRPVVAPGGVETIIELPDSGGGSEWTNSDTAKTKSEFSGMHSGTSRSLSGQTENLSQPQTHEPRPATPSQSSNASKTASSGEAAAGADGRPLVVDENWPAVDENGALRNPPPDDDEGIEFEPGTLLPRAPRVPEGELAEWFNTTFHDELAKLKSLGGTKRDLAAQAMFAQLAARLPGIAMVTKARVKRIVCDALDLTAREYDKALTEANAAAQKKADAGWLSMAERFKADLWNGRSGEAMRAWRYWREIWYEWSLKEGCYLKQSDKWVQAKAVLWLSANGIEPTMGSVADFLQALRASTILHDDVRPGVWLAHAPEDSAGAIYVSLKNGILDLTRRDRPMIEHTPDFFTLNAVPFDYRPGATCPKWNEATLTWQPLDATGAAHQLLRDWMGYLFVPYNPHKKFLICTGPGDDGKSVYARICRAILGERNCSALGLEAFDPKMDFGLEPMLGKMLNQITDANHVEKVAEGSLKSLTGNDPFTFKRKYVSAITEVWSGKVMMNANATPYWRDRSNALFNRMLPLHWNSIPPDKMNPGLVDELIATELSGIFNWAMDGFDRIRREPFNRSGLVMSWVEEARRETQSELEFFDTCIGYELSLCSLQKVYGEDLMKAYQEHCGVMNVKAFCNSQTLGRQLREWLKRRFREALVAEDLQRDWFARFNDRDSQRDEQYKRRPFYRGIWLLS